MCHFLMIRSILSDMKQASLPSPIAERALARDKECIFTGDSPTSNSDTLVATWILPPFVGCDVSTITHVRRSYPYGSYHGDGAVR